jgi:hypothetical protein
MTRGDAFVAQMKQLVALAAELPDGAQVTVDWWNGAPDLLLAVAMLRGGHLCSATFTGGGKVQWAEWKRGNVVVRAQESRPAGGSVRPVLRLVKP